MEIEIRGDMIALRVFPESHLEQIVLKEMIDLAGKGATVRLFERDKGVEVVVGKSTSAGSSSAADLAAYATRNAVPMRERWNQGEPG